MKKLFRKCLVLTMVLSMLFSLSAAGYASEESSGSPVVISYTVDDANVNKGDIVNISARIKHTGITASDVSAGFLDVTRVVDSFEGGRIDVALVNSVSGQLEFDVSVSGAKYKGTGNSLKLMVGYVGTSAPYENLEINIVECKEYEEPVYEEPEPYVPDPVAAPMMIISRGELPANISAGEEMTVTVNVQNIGSTSMTSPVISFTPSDYLMMTGTASMYQLKTIAPGKTESIDVKIRALDEISSQVQYIDAEVKFQYFNRVTTAEGSGSGRVIIPANVKKEKEPETTDVESPVPNLIVGQFSYGGSSVAAGNNFTLGFRFTNTSENLDVENVVVTVDGGTSFTINGAANTIYFDEIEAGGEKRVSVPMKALQTLANGAEPVMINFKYEYVDNRKRISASSDVKITVPVYQPDRFEITSPTVPVMVYAGEELNIMMNYVNKGKSPVNNLEARVEGIDTITPVQNLGNIEAGRSGTMAFAVTPSEPGEAEFTIKVVYEDANGQEKEMLFPVSITVEQMEIYDPGFDEPIIEPEQESTVPWKLIGGVAVVLAAISAIIIRKKRKAAKSKKEAQMWESWDEEDEASPEEQASSETSLEKRKEGQ
ncbi:MAG: hypothetical protein IJB73_00700 [Firmicutes bacterium]|nr:hypothetical protein [Bacillota bacterium]